MGAPPSIYQPQIVGWNAGGGNTKIFNCWNSADTLFEDTAGSGSERKVYGRQGDTRCTPRRGFGMKTCDTGGGWGGAPHTYDLVASPITENMILARVTGRPPMSAGGRG